MKFEVVKKINNQVMMHTEQEQCVSFEHLDSQNTNYYFRVNGKKMDANGVRKALPEAYKEWCKQNNQKPQKSSSATSTPTTPTSRKVRCLDTGEIFDNQSLAAKHFAIDPAQVSDSIKTGRPRSGYTFERMVE